MERLGPSARCFGVFRRVASLGRIALHCAALLHLKALIDKSFALPRPRPPSLSHFGCQVRLQPTLDIMTESSEPTRDHSHTGAEDCEDEGYFTCPPTSPPRASQQFWGLKTFEQAQQKPGPPSKRMTFTSVTGVWSGEASHDPEPVQDHQETMNNEQSSKGKKEVTTLEPPHSAQRPETTQAPMETELMPIQEPTEESRPSTAKRSCWAQLKRKLSFTR